MPVNKEELAQDLATPEYQQIVKEALAKKDFVIQAKDEHQQYLDRFKADVLEKEMPTKVSELHSRYDKDIKDLFGVDRETNEKSYDYLKRAASAKLTELNSSAQKIRDLEQAIATGTGGKALQAKLEQEEQRFKTLLKERDSKIQELEQKSTITAKSADVKLLYGDLKKSFIKQLPPLFERSEAAILDEVIRNSVIKDGKLYMANADGSIRKDGSFNEVTVESYLRSEFKDVIEQQKKTGGAGSPPSGGADPGLDPKALKPDNFPMRDDIKTKAQLTDYMLSLGLKQGTPEFMAIWKKYGLPMGA